MVRERLTSETTRRLTGEMLLGLWVLALPCIAFFWVVSCNSGVGVKCIFWKATSSQYVYECFGYSMENEFYVFMLGLAMGFNAYLMDFKIIVEYIEFCHGFSMSMCILMHEMHRFWFQGQMN